MQEKSWPHFHPDLKDHQTYLNNSRILYIFEKDNELYKKNARLILD